jgi:hypothetical protein
LLLIEEGKLTIINIHNHNPNAELDPLHIELSTQTNLPKRNDNTTFFEYYNVMNEEHTIIENFDVLLKANEDMDIGNMFLMNKGLGVIEIGNTAKGFINLIEKLYLTNGAESPEFFFVCLINLKL